MRCSTAGDNGGAPFVALLAGGRESSVVEAGKRGMAVQRVRQGRWPVMAPMGGGAELLCSAWEKGEREGEGKEKRKGEKEKKGKRKKKKKRERGVGAIRGGSRPRALCDIWSDSDARGATRRGR